MSQQTTAAPTQPITIALAGNPNSGKTTLFNALTGSNQFVGNWPGVTVEKKEGKLKGHKHVTITDLPGIYSLSPYTLEEVVARNYLIDERPQVILNIIDGTNLERNLFLTTQLVELGIPVVVAINMMDVVEKNGDVIHIAPLSKALGCPVCPVSALKGTGVQDLAALAIAAAQGTKTVPQHSFSGGVEHTLAHIEEAVLHNLPQEQQRFFAIKLFERDAKITAKLALTPEQVEHIQQDIQRRETELGDDSESIITAERYTYIETIVTSSITRKRQGQLSTSDKIDKIVTNRFLALPIFALVMFIVYYISVTTVGTFVTDFTNDGLFGEGFHLMGGGAFAEATEAFEAGELPLEPSPEDYGVWVPGIPVLLGQGLEAIHCAAWLQGLVLDGVVAGVGAVLGFVPQMLILFLFLAFLEGCGYMARIAFVMDRIFRRFGLSGKSFIPILIGTGCGVPALMASRTIESERDRKMTLITTTFIPCSAKLPIIALIAGAVFGGAGWVATSAYFIGIAAIICSSIALKKTKFFAGETAPFVMELPAYHWPTFGFLLRSMWERGSSFIKKAGTLILLATVFVWFTSFFGWVQGKFQYLTAEQMDLSILAKLGKMIAPIFYPLGWGDWKSAVAAFTGLMAKENVVGTFGILFGFSAVSENGEEVWGALAANYTPIAAFSFLLFNLLCAPCFAAMGAIKREMNNLKWFAIAIGYQCIFAYIVAFCTYQLGFLVLAGHFAFGTIAAFLLLAAFLFLLLRPAKKLEKTPTKLMKGA